MTLPSTYWSVPQAIVWIVLRDIQQADHATELSSRFEAFFFVAQRQQPDWAFTVDGTIREHRGTESGKEVDLACEEIINGAAAGKLELIGIRDGNGDPCKIDSAFLSAAKFCDVPDQSDESICLTPSTYPNKTTTRFTQVRLKRAGVLDLWPAVTDSVVVRTKSVGGRPPNGDRDLMKDILRAEVEKHGGWPSSDCAAGWRTPGDVDNFFVRVWREKGWPGADETIIKARRQIANELKVEDSKK